MKEDIVANKPKIRKQLVLSNDSIVKATKIMVNQNRSFNNLVESLIIKEYNEKYNK